MYNSFESIIFFNVMCGRKLLKVRVRIKMMHLFFQKYNNQENKISLV